jgi:hypothetical protein
MEKMTGNCEKTILNPNSNTGMIHIAQVQKIIVGAPATPGGDRTIEVFFSKTIVEFTRAKYHCPPPPGFKGGPAKGDNTAVMTMVPIPAIPYYIKFIAKEGEQIIDERGRPGSELHYKIWVEKVKDDSYQ